MEEQKTEDYKERLQKARQRRNGKDPMHWFMIGGCAVIVVLALVIIVKLAQGRHVRRFWKRPGGIGIRGRGAGNRDRRDAAGG